MENFIQTILDGIDFENDFYICKKVAKDDQFEWVEEGMIFMFMDKEDEITSLECYGIDIIVSLTEDELKEYFVKVSDLKHKFLLELFLNDLTNHDFDDDVTQIINHYKNK